ncbi:MAG TPA: hypothetical protein VE442_12570, partial [Jatrophihabitans sp.]|nr:hypothetical protein [Jatrophihabitans sp.]
PTLRQTCTGPTPLPADPGSNPAKPSSERILTNIGASNGLLRQYFPKGTDLARWSSEEIEAVAATLNNRPRKTLGWRTPAEAFNKQLMSVEQSGVASIR